MKVFVKTYGCATNQYDSEIISGIVSQKHKLVSSEKNADLIIVNTCIVKQTTEQKALYYIEHLPRDKKVLVAGCMPQVQADRILSRRKSASLLGVFSLSKVKKAVNDIAKGKQVKILDKIPEEKPVLPCLRTDKVCAITSISEGCLGFCSFCIVRKARGRLRSFSQDSILKSVEKSLKDGFKEIRITAQDTGIYGFDTNSTLPKLLNGLVMLNGDFRVRVGMMNPSGALKILPELIESFKSDKIYKFLHLPVQSGSDKVLRDMNRLYSVSNFKKIVKEFRKEIPNLQLATDIIVGYPTEMEKDFQKSLKLVKEIKPDVVNISRFTPREGTPAAKLKKLKTQILKERSKIMTDICEEVALQNNKKYVGKKDTILLTEIGKNKTIVGKASNYKSVVVGSGEPGEFVNVEFTEAFPTYLKARQVL